MSMGSGLFSEEGEQEEAGGRRMIEGRINGVCIAYNKHYVPF